MIGTDGPIGIEEYMASKTGEIGCVGVRGMTAPTSGAGVTASAARCWLLGGREPEFHEKP